MYCQIPFEGIGIVPDGNVFNRCSSWLHKPLFIELMKAFNFDSVHFAKINNWGTYTEEEFRQVAIHRKDHPERENFLKILRNPILRDSIVSIDFKEGE